MTSTMATLEMDNNPFIPVTKAHTTKKAQAANQAGAQAKPKIKMELCLVFQLPCQPTTTFNPLLKSNSFSQRWLSMTHWLPSSLSLIRTYYPAHNPFPSKETKFQQYFHVHNQPKWPVNQNLIMIGCHLFSRKTITDIKQSMLEMHTMMEWLTNDHLFIEADSLRCKVIQTIGYYFNLHPNITHCTSFKMSISDSLDFVRMTKAKVLELTLEASEHYEMDTDDNNASFPFVPPFELFITYISYGTSNNWVCTQAISIKMSIAFGNLLHELLLCMATTQIISSLSTSQLE